MRIASRFLVAVSLALATGGVARAGYVFQFTDSSGTAQSAFTVNQGSTIDIRVYLMQTGPDTGLSASGLSQGGVQLNYNGSIAGVASGSAVTANPAFTDTPTVTVTSNSASLNVATLNGSGVMAPTTGADANRVLLGTFTFTGVSAGTTTALTADPHPNPAIADNVLANSTVLDSLIANSSVAITVNAVPEPGTLVLTGLLAAGIAGGAARRFRRPPA
jgi:hypothetical protein